MPFPVITIDLETPPSRRWEPLKPYAAAAREMVEFYLRDLGSEGKHLEPFAAELLPREFRDELDGMSELLAIEPGDLLKLEESLAKLANDAPLRTALGQAGRELVKEEFSVDQLVQRQYELYKRLLAKA